MKIKNIAFFGVMATILSIAGANAAGTTPATVIASTNYVDTKTGNLTDLATTAKTNLVAAVNEIKSSALTEHQSLSNYYTKTEADNRYDAKNAASTAKSQIEGKLDDGANGYDINAKSLKVQGSPVLTSHQSLSNYYTKSETDTVATNAANAKVSSAATISATSETTAPNEKAVSTALGGKENSSNKTTTGLITADNNGAITTVADGTNTAYASTSAISSDLKKVKAAIAAAQTAATYNDTALAGRVTALEGAGYITKSVNNLENYTTTTNMNTAINAKVSSANSISTTSTSTAPNEKAVSDALSNKQAKFNDGTTTGTGEAIVSVTQSGGKVDSTKSLLTYGGAMNSTLPEINGVANNTCSASNPCILTYTGTTGGYKWTTLDLGVVAAN